MQNLVDVLPDGQQINLVIFQDYIHPIGHLTHAIECHALFYYYLHAQRTYEEFVKQNIMYEGEPDSQVNFKQLFLSIASLYGVNPENMANYWPLIDKQCEVLSMPFLKDSWEYRFKSIINLH